MLSEKNKIIQKIPNISSSEVKNIHLFINEALLFNNKHNIFVRDGFDDVLNKDILDCMPLIKKINNNTKTLDLGSGGGFPGILIAILKASCEIHLVEKAQKKAYFLKKMKDMLKLKNIEVINNKLLINNNIGVYDVITARAFSSTQNIIEITSNNIKKGSKYLLLKGREEKIMEELHSVDTNKYKYEIIKIDYSEHERHLVEINLNE